MGSNLKKTLKYVLSLGLAIVLLYFSFRNVQWKNFWLALKSCRWGFVILSMCFGVMSFYFRGLRWRRLLLPIDPSTKRITTFNAVNISYVVNMVLPRVGEVVRCGYITRDSSKDDCGNKKATFDKVLGTAIADRLWDALMLAVLVVVLLLITWRRFGGFFSNDVISPISSGSSQTLIWIILSVFAIVAVLTTVVFLLKEKNRVCAKIWNLIKGVFQGLVSSIYMKYGWIFILLNLLVWSMYLMTCTTIVWALQGMDTSTMSIEMAVAFDKINGLNMVDAMFLMIVGALSSLVPVPGGFGAFHYIVSLALTTVYGIPTEIGIVFATLSHESQTIIQIVCGGISYACETIRRKTI